MIRGPVNYRMIRVIGLPSKIYQTVPTSILFLRLHFSQHVFSMMVLPTEACWLQGKARGIPRMSQRCRNPDSIVITIINAKSRTTLMMGKHEH